ncbi:restriction endonuclease subunit S [Streptococcus sp. ZY1909104]|uniref:restriction endonuclease subunit S n=1 Tax=Streptococcus sp. ZY1909104 TaxID=3233335 RepID=UPI00349F6316
MSEVKLGDIGKISMCKRILKSQTNEVSGIPFYKISTFGGIADVFIDEAIFHEYKSKYSYPKKGDILISAAGTVGKTVIYTGEDAYFQDSNIVWIDNNEKIVTNQYLYYFYQTNPFVSTNGSTIKRLYNDNIRETKIKNVPSIEAQNKVTKVLEYLDQKIALNNQINEELEAMAKTLYDYWFVQFDFPDENGKPYKSSGGKMVYNDQLKREIPEGWGVKQLGEVSICHDSRRVPLSSKDRENKNGIIPYYGATGIMDYIDDFIFEGDYILMAEDGSVMTSEGKPILQRITGKTWVNNHAHVLEPTNEYSCKLLLLSLKDISVLQIKTGSIQMKITQENMNKILLPDIGRDLLSKINEVLLPIDEKQLKLLKQNQELTQLRDWLLPMLMNGQVRVE